MSEPSKASPDHPVRDSPHVTIEMGGPNIVIRSSSVIDREYTTALVHAVNSAAVAGTVVVIDPEPVRCDDTFAAQPAPAAVLSCPDHARCRPADVEVVSAGVIRIDAERTSWTIDLNAGRLCRTDGAIDIRFLDADAWTPVVAIRVTPAKLSALTTDGTVITSARAHRPVTAAVA